MQCTKDTPIHHLFFKVFIFFLCVFLLTACSKSPSNGESDSSQMETSPSSNANGNFTVFLDAGHGGKDRGAQTSDIYEKDINLQIVQKVKNLLEQNGYQVAVSRDSDTQVSLEDRVSLAEKANADVFVSIHQNSVDNDTTPHGIATHCNETVNPKSAELAELVQKEVVKNTEGKDRGVTKDSNLYVLNSSDIPSCLIESGFLTSDTEGPLLQQSAYQDKIALGIAEAVNQFLNGDNTEELQTSSESSAANSSDESSDSQESPDPSSGESSESTDSSDSDPANSESQSSESGDETGSSQSEGTKTTSGEPNPDEKVVYITIDDGPTTGTPKLLDILDEYNAKATWFVTGQYMEGTALEDMLKQIHDKGHAIGVHTFSHKYTSIYASVDAYMEDYNKMNTIIVNATGESSGLFRFPGGSNAGYNKKIRTELLSRVKSEGLVYYDWNAFTGDTEGMSKSEMVSKAVKECSYNNKAILLMHDVPGKDAVVEALPEILSQLQAKGYEFRALDKDVVPIQFEK